MSWTPNIDGVNELASLFADVGAPATLQRLDAFTKNVPDFNAYLVYLLAACPNLPVVVRQTAGLRLRQNISHSIESLDAQVLQYIHGALTLAWRDPESAIRQTSGQISAVLLSRMGLSAWPEGAPSLLLLLDEVDPAVQRDAFKTISHLAYEFRIRYGNTADENNLLQIIIQKMVQASSHTDNKIRLLALDRLNEFVEGSNKAVELNIEAIASAVFLSASDTDSKIRLTVCRAIVNLLSFWPDVLTVHAVNVADLMLHQTASDDPEIALAACEFWLEFAVAPDFHDILKTLLPRLLPVLLNCAVYTEEQAHALQAQNDDSSVPDRDSDVKPRHYNAKGHGQTDQKQQHVSAAISTQDADDNDGGDDDDGEEEEEWSLRTCAAKAMEDIAVFFPQDVLDILLPLLTSGIVDQNWYKQEAAILCIGAISEGCLDDMQNHLGSIIPYLLQKLNHEQSLIKSITCWTLGRYAQWISENNAQRTETIFLPLLQALLTLASDNHKSVQAASCTALTALEDEAGQMVAPYVNTIIDNLVPLFKRYQRQNLLILYDTLSSLVEAAGTLIDAQRNADLLLLPLCEQWMRFEGGDERAVPVMQCIGGIMPIFASPSATWTISFWQRSLQIIYDCNCDNFQGDDTLSEILISAWDLVSGLVQGLQSNIESFISSTPQFFSLLIRDMQSNNASIAQSSLAVLGDLSIASYASLSPSLDIIMPLLLHTMTILKTDNSNAGAVNNALWASGEIALRSGTEMQLYSEKIIEHCVAIATMTKVRRATQGLPENACVALARLGLVLPMVVAPHLIHFAAAWCRVMKLVPDSDEKESAFMGFCKIASANPNGLGSAFGLFCEAVCHWQTPSEELNHNFHAILSGFAQMAGSSWPDIRSQLSSTIQQRLSTRYQL